MYVDAATVDPATLFQGDILEDFPFQNLAGGQAVRRRDNGLFELDGAQTTDRSLQVIESSTRRVMILSQTCDIQRRNNVIVCPVHELAQFTADNTLNADSVRDIKARRNYYLFYLPAFSTLPEAIADLQTMIYVPRLLMVEYLPARSISLSDLGRHTLSWSLASFFGRPALP